MKFLLTKQILLKIFLKNSVFPFSDKMNCKQRRALRKRLHSTLINLSASKGSPDQLKGENFNSLLKSYLSDKETYQKEMKRINETPRDYEEEMGIEIVNGIFIKKEKCEERSETDVKIEELLKQNEELAKKVQTLEQRNEELENSLKNKSNKVEILEKQNKEHSKLLSERNFEIVLLNEKILNLESEVERKTEIMHFQAGVLQGSNHQDVTFLENTIDKLLEKCLEYEKTLSEISDCKDNIREIYLYRDKQTRCIENFSERVKEYQEQIEIRDKYLKQTRDKLEYVRMINEKVINEIRFENPGNCNEEFELLGKYEEEMLKKAEQDIELQKEIISTLNNRLNEKNQAILNLTSNLNYCENKLKQMEWDFLYEEAMTF